MKMKLFAILLVAVLMPHASVLASSSNASPLIGSWVVDVSRLPMPPQARPKRVTITFSDAGDGAWRTDVDIVDAGGAQSRAVSTATLDGKPTPVVGSSEADIVAVKMPVPNVLVLALGKGGIPASTRIYAAAADRKTMIETAVYFGDNGLPVTRTNYFTRVR
ncbi:MAG TPA: hypothetical protein VGH81_13960 [Rudaea sp.]|jgi:hypothetical protein